MTLPGHDDALATMTLPASRACFNSAASSRTQTADALQFERAAEARGVEIDGVFQPSLLVLTGRHDAHSWAAPNVSRSAARRRNVG